MEDGDAWDHMVLLLASRRGIVQHASEGWSAFSVVPALARALPLLNTGRWAQVLHHFERFAQWGAIPNGTLFMCEGLDAFVAAVPVNRSSALV